MSDSKRRYSELVTVANKINDPLTQFEIDTVILACEKVVMKSFKRNNIPSDILDQAFKLVEKNLKPYYQQSSWGWNAAEKLKEMEDNAAYYLLLEAGKKFVGFSHFRFDLDYGVPVLYCYEIQIEESYQRMGFGSVILDTLYNIAQFTSMHKVVVTVFCSNERSLQFFRKNKFRRDKTSPGKTENADYIILSRSVK